MKNKISKDDLGNDVFTLTYDGSMEVEVFIENNNVCLFNYFGNGCDSDYISIPIGDWQEVKEWVDSQIVNSMGVSKDLLGGRDE